MKNKPKFIYETLLVRYGQLNWWPTIRRDPPAETPYEVIVGAVLTQNTAWRNVEKALANFGAKLSPQAVSDMELAELSEIIRPAGFFNQKSVYLKSVTAWFAQYGFDVQKVREKSLEDVRAELLSVKGVGKETADSILLYAFGFPSFVVDAYTMRFCGRYPIDAGTGYDAVKKYFEAHIPASSAVYNNYHALIVINAKEHCRKKPLCEGCPLYDFCGRVGV